MSKQVKIVLCSESFEQDDYYSYMVIRDSISDWETVSDEDYEFLKSNLFRIYREFNSFKLTPMLVAKDDKPIVERIDSIKSSIENEKRKREEEKAKEETKKAERTKKRIMKKEQDELALLKQLQKKFGVK